MTKFLITFTLFIIIVNPLLAQWQVTSPSGNIKATIQQANDGSLSYFVQYMDGNTTSTVINSSPLGILRSDQTFRTGLAYENSSSQIIDDHYSMIIGKQSSLWNHANELKLSFHNSNNAKIQVIFRAYNDGITFKYYFPENSGAIVNVYNESTGFNIPTNGNAWIEPVGYTPMNELRYNKTPIGTNSSDWGWAFPALFQSNNFWILLAEAGLDANYFATHLSGTATGGMYRVVPPDQYDGNDYSNVTTSTLPFGSPWRVILLGKTVNTIVESTLITNLGEPSKVSNTSWIKPGIASWSWWSDLGSSQDYNKQVTFVNFASAMGLPYTIVDYKWTQMTGGTMSQLAQYAQSKNVGLFVWYSAGGPYTEQVPRLILNDPTTRRAEFQMLKNMGIKGIKVDYFMSDKQYYVKLYLDILKDAADYQLMVIFHGGLVQKGWTRTYPNLLAMEGIKGGESYILDGSFRGIDGDSPSHNVNTIFTRSVLGSADYTPCVIGIERVYHNTTTAHELALINIIESGIISLADKPDNFYTLPPLALQIIQHLPVTWDETKFIEGYPEDYVVMARRKGRNWYISGINGKNAARTINLNLNFLQSGNYKKNSILDGIDARHINTSETTYQTGSNVSISMLPFGGFLTVFEAKCLSQLTLNDVTATGSLTEKAYSIISTSKVNNIANVGYLAQNYVLLNAGFVADKGTVFKADLTGCN